MTSMNNPRLALIGGDLRQIAAAAELKRYFNISLYGFAGSGNSACKPSRDSIVDSQCCSSVSSRESETDRYIADLKLTVADSLDEALENTNAVVLPLPATGSGKYIMTPCSSAEIPTLLLLDKLTEHKIKLLCGGKLDENLKNECAQRNIDCFDYYEREEFTVANALVTAEGAISLAMSELPITLHGSRSLVLGYGRIGKMLASRLYLLGSDTTVTARKPSDIGWIKAAGMSFADTRQLCELLESKKFDIIYNTVPELILTERELEAIAPETLIIDLASKPGGVDVHAAAKLARRVIWALSLPGKCSPISAGRIIADTLLGYFAEVGL